MRVPQLLSFVLLTGLEPLLIARCPPCHNAKVPTSGLELTKVAGIVAKKIGA